MRQTDDLISRQEAIEEIIAQEAIYSDDAVEILKRLPSAQPERPFETQDILDYLDTVLHPLVSPEHWNVYSKLHDMIAALPSAQPEPRWIPCSERLPDHPENDDYYLVTIQCEHYDGWDDYVTGFAEWTKHGWDELSCYIGQIKVVAWMPLPEPYKEGEKSER